MELIISLLVLLGSFVVLLAGIGMVRFPNLLLRMHALSKAGSLGVVLLIHAVMVQHPTWQVILGGLLSITLGFLTIPLTSHMVSRSYLTREQMLPRLHTAEPKSDRQEPR